MWERLRAKGEEAGEDEIVGWNHQFSGYELGWTLGDGEGQGGLACCSSWGRKSWTQLSKWTATSSLLLIEQSGHLSLTLKALGRYTRTSYELPPGWNLAIEWSLGVGKPASWNDRCFRWVLSKTGSVCLKRCQRGHLWRMLVWEACVGGLLSLMAPGTPSSSRCWCFHRAEIQSQGWGSCRSRFTSYSITPSALWPWGTCLMYLSLFPFFMFTGDDRLLPDPWVLLSGVVQSTESLLHKPRAGRIWSLVGLYCGCQGPQGSSFHVCPTGWLQVTILS